MYVIYKKNGYVFLRALPYWQGEKFCGVAPFLLSGKNVFRARGKIIKPSPILYLSHICRQQSKKIFANGRSAKKKRSPTLNQDVTLYSIKSWSKHQTCFS